VIPFSAAERDWKEYKAFASKARAQLAPEKLQIVIDSRRFTQK
jgi:hypothetical protein